MENENAQILEQSPDVQTTANGATQGADLSTHAGGDAGADTSQAGDVTESAQELVIERAPRVVTPEILNAAQILCGMTQEQIDARIAAVFDRLEAA